MAGEVRPVELRYGELGTAGMVSPGLVSCGAIWYGRRGVAGRAVLRPGKSWQAW